MEQARGRADAKIPDVQLQPADRDYGVDSQSFQGPKTSDLRLDGFENQRSGGIVHFRDTDKIGGGSGFLSLRSREILSGLAIPADNQDPKSNSEIDV